jgi:hypothetical protein
VRLLGDKILHICNRPSSLLICFRIISENYSDKIGIATSRMLLSNICPEIMGIDINVVSGIEYLLLVIGHFVDRKQMV